MRYAYGFGSSQSGRFLRSFLYEGFNTDERDRQVFDGVMAHIAGAARINLNARWSTPVGLGVYSATAFPFADASLRDPVSGAQEGLLENPRARAHQPKVFYTNTPVEYWGTGRVAALVHTTPDGTADLRAAGQRPRLFHRGHAALARPVSAIGQRNGQQTRQPGRLLAGRCARCCWRCTSGCSAGTAPPPSAYPMLQIGTLVPSGRRRVSGRFPASPRRAG